MSEKVGEFREKAEKWAKLLREQNKGEAAPTCFHLLLGVLDSIAEGTPPPSRDTMISLVLAYGENANAVLHSEVFYEIGKQDFSQVRSRSGR